MGCEKHDITRRRNPGYTFWRRDRGFYSSRRSGTLRATPGPAAYTLPHVMGYENDDTTTDCNSAYKIAVQIPSLWNETVIHAT
jgi:hypothetical protein